jgi:orotate phosphoribosyltransferase
VTSEATVKEGSAEQLLKSVGAWLTGHFLLTSGLHSDQYMQCQKVLQYPRLGLQLADQLVEKVLAAGLKPTTVVGPALGAIHWEVMVACALDKRLAGEPVRGLFAERGAEPDVNAFQIRRGLELSPGEKVLVVEDVTTTGGSARKVVELVRALGADPVAVGAIVDRSGSTVSFGIPFIKLITLQLQTHEASQCPMCKEGSVAIKPGSNKKAQA